MSRGRLMVWIGPGFYSFFRLAYESRWVLKNIDHRVHDKHYYNFCIKIRNIYSNGEYQRYKTICFDRMKFVWLWASHLTERARTTSYSVNADFDQTAVSMNYMKHRVVRTACMRTSTWRGFEMELANKWLQCSWIAWTSKFWACGHYGKRLSSNEWMPVKHISNKTVLTSRR